MKLDQLTMFTTVTELGSLKAASEALFKTQAAVSQGITKLEQELSVTLFHRDQYRLKITDPGALLYQQAKRVLRESSQLGQMAHHYANGNETSVTIAFEASFDLSRLLPLLEQSQNKFPETQIILKQEYLSGAYEKLQQGEADIALTPIFPDMRGTLQLTTVPLYQGALITSASPKLTKRFNELSHAKQLINEYQILVKDSGTATGAKNLGVQTGQRHWHVTDFSTKKMLILSGMGWGKLPDFLIKKELASGELIRLELEGLNTTVKPTYSLIKTNGKILGPVGEDLWQAISAVQEVTL